MTIKLPGINFSNFVYTVFPHSFICALFISSFAVIWRAQIAVRAKAASVPITNIPRLATSKFIAGEVMTHQIAYILPATHSVLATLPWEANALTTSSTIEEKTDVIHNAALGMLDYKGPSRLLQLHQITPDNLNIHRKGLIAQAIGKMQNDPIYLSHTIAPGKDIYKMDFEEFFGLFVGMCD
jgi:hypothetical protein